MMTAGAMTSAASPRPTLEVADSLLDQMPVESNADWQPIVRETDGFIMVLVPAGCFIMGEEPASEASRQRQEVCFERHFWIDRFEVTNKQYRAVLGDDTPLGRWEDDERPRENISWEDAVRFCRLRGGHLPTGAEWEYAARGPDNWLYPWGDEFDAARVVFRDSFSVNERPETAPVRQPAGCGNMGRGLRICWAMFRSGIADGFDDPSERLRILRGGSALNNELSLLSEERYRFSLTWLGDYDGFRCVRE